MKRSTKSSSKNSTYSISRWRTEALHVTYVSWTFPLKSHVTKSLTPNDTTIFAKRYSHNKIVNGTRGFSKTITEYYDDDIVQPTALSKSSDARRYGHVYSISLTSRNRWQPGSDSYLLSSTHNELLAANGNRCL